MFKREAKIMVAILSAPLFLGLIAGLVGPRMFDRLCENVVVQSYPSINNEFEAVLFQRECGATTGITTQVSIIKGGSKLPRGKGNIFIADDGDTEMPLAPWGGPLVEIEWVGDNKVIVEYPRGTRIILNEKRYKVIQIEYRLR